MSNRFAVFAFTPANKIVNGITSEVFDVLHAIFANRNQHCCGQAWKIAKFVFDTKRLATVVLLAFDAFQEFACTFLNFTGGVFIETVDRSDFAWLDISKLFNRGKAFGSQNLTNHLINVEGFHKEVRTLGEFLLATFGFFVFRQDVDIPAGQLRSKAHVLTATTNCQ